MQQETEPQQEPEDIAVLALARGCSHSEAAAQAGIHRTSITRWLRDPEFRERIAVSRREILAQATGKLSDRILSAIDTLTDLLKSETETTRLQAARALLGSLLPLNLQQNLEERISQLEGQK